MNGKCIEFNQPDPIKLTVTRFLIKLFSLISFHENGNSVGVVDKKKECILLNRTFEVQCRIPDNDC
jgi:hypothetical protein